MRKPMTVIACALLSCCALFAGGCSSSNAPQATSSSELIKEGRRVYFAAPLFSEAERDYNLKITHVLEQYDYQVFLPQRDGFLAPELEGLTEEQKTTKIFNKDYEEILKADIFFGILDGRTPDEGVCVELGIAYCEHKRCYGFKTDARSVELDMNLNPMITGCLEKLFYNTDGEACLKSLTDYLSTNQL